MCNKCKLDHNKQTITALCRITAICMGPLCRHWTHYIHTYIHTYVYPPPLKKVKRHQRNMNNNGVQQKSKKNFATHVPKTIANRLKYARHRVPNQPSDVVQPPLSIVASSHLTNRLRVSDYAAMHKVILCNIHIHCMKKCSATGGVLVVVCASTGVEGVV